jgi:hypothetical protein
MSNGKNCTFILLVFYFIDVTVLISHCNFFFLKEKINKSNFDLTFEARRTAKKSKEIEEGDEAACLRSQKKMEGTRSYKLEKLKIWGLFVEQQYRTPHNINCSYIFFFSFFIINQHQNILIFYITSIIFFFFFKNNVFSKPSDLRATRKRTKKRREVWSIND